MEGLQKALIHLRAWYKERGGPSYSQIADSSGISESTAQRYLGDDPVKRPNYTTIVSIASTLGMTTADLSLNKDIVEGMEKEQLANLVLELRRINIDELSAQREADDARWRERLDADQQKFLSRIQLLTKEHADEMARVKDAHADEMARVKDAHADEMRRSNDAHQAHVLQIHQMYEKQFSTMLEGHQRQIDSVQRIDAAQQETMRSMAETQKAADEKSKDFLKGRIEQLDHRSKIKDRIIFSLIFCIILLFVVDFFLPSMGWIRRLSSTLFSYHTFS